MTEELKVVVEIGDTPWEDIAKILSNKTDPLEELQILSRIVKSPDVTKIPWRQRRQVTKAVADALVKDAQGLG